MLPSFFVLVTILAIAVFYQWLIARHLREKNAELTLKTEAQSTVIKLGDEQRSQFIRRATAAEQDADRLAKCVVAIVEDGTAWAKHIGVAAPSFASENHALDAHRMAQVSRPFFAKSEHAKPTRQQIPSPANVQAVAAQGSENPA
jgi:hypothetical protein